MNTITIPKKLNKEVKYFISKAIYEVLTDPDFSKELTAKAKKRLKRALVNKKTTSFLEIKKRYC